MIEKLKRSGALYTHTHTGIQIYTIKEVLFKCLFNYRERGDKYLILSLCGSDKNG